MASSTNIVVKMKYIYYYIFYFFITFYRKITGYREPKKESVIKTTQNFVEIQKQRFLETFEETEYKNYLYSSNIDECFYIKSKYVEMMEDVNNELEKKWKTNLLYKNTPYGNVMMFYDVYKNGFAYYSDVNLNYQILNALAMNYVITFYCRDLYVDEKTLPEDKRDMKIYKMIQEIEKENEKKTKNKKGKEEDFKSIYREQINEQKKKKDLPFIKVKKNEVNKKEEKILQTNKFIYLGKMVNFQFLKREPMKKTLPLKAISSSNSNDNIIDINLQNNQSLTWEQFKKIKEKNKG